ncbi:MAG: hypothetical protein IPP32_12660 [Bacteroidetes bacterium]|nr:hypothetical protein [Bacteroidota bacterium]
MKGILPFFFIFYLLVIALNPCLSAPLCVVVNDTSSITNQNPDSKTKHKKSALRKNKNSKQLSFRDSSNTTAYNDTIPDKKKDKKQTRRARLKNKTAQSKESATNAIDTVKSNASASARNYSKDSLKVDLSKSDTLLKLKYEETKEVNKSRLSQYSKDSLKNKLNVTDSSLLKAKDDFVRNNLTLDSSKKDKLVADQKAKLKNKKDALNQLVPHKPSSYFDRTTGTVNVGYDYGVVPFVVGGKTPSGFVRTDGNLGFDVLKIPVQFNYYYANIKNISGLNNYFRLSLDVPKYKENAQLKLNDEVQGLKSNLGELYSSRQLLEQKILYLKTIQNQKNFNTSELTQQLNSEKITPSSYSQTLGDTSGMLSNLKNSGNTKLPSTDSLQTKNYSDSLNQLSKEDETVVKAKKMQQRADSVNQVIQKYKSEKDKIQGQIEEINQKIKMLQHPDSISNPMLAKYKKYNILDYVKKLEIGLCYPDYSTFLISGSGVKGLNLEMQKSKLYFAFTYGKTINNLLFSNNVVQNNLQNVRNLYNFFDFREVSSGRRVTAFKLGFGAKEKSHFHAGFLYGIGQNSYQFTSENAPTNAIEKEKNYVIELDGKYVFNSKFTLDLIYGKSYLQQITEPDSDKGFHAISKSNQHTNAGLGRFTASLNSTRIQLTSRYVDPYFKSFGVGFMRSDNFRYELKVDQTISRKLKIGASYKKEQDNLLHINYLTTNLQTLNSYFTYRPVRQLTVRFSFSPVLQRVNSEDKIVRIENKNYISSAIVSYSPKLKKNQTTFTLLYNYFKLYDGIQNSIYQNYSFVNSLSIGEFKNEFALSYFDSNIPDSTVTSFMLYSDDISIRLKKKYVITLGGKLSQSKTGSIQTGYNLKVYVPIKKYFAFELSGEKIVLGDFYNNYLLEQIDKFPYYMYAKLIFNW